MLNNNPVLILIKAIVAVYINRQLPSPIGKLDRTLENVDRLVVTPKDVVGEGSDGEVAQALNATLHWVKALPQDTALAKMDLTERVRINCSFESDYVGSLDRLLEIDDDSYKNALRVKGIISEIENELRELEFKDFFKEANRQVNFSQKRLDITEFSKGFFDKLKEFEGASGDGEKPGFGGKLSTENRDTVKDVLDNAVSLRSTEGGLITGLKGLNLMLGGQHIRGEQFNFGALTHNYKTGILLDYCRWLCMHNEPFMYDKNKKPLILRFSFENKPEQDIPILYKSLWEAEHQKKVDFAEIDSDEATDYIIERLTSRGYNFEMLCYDPNSFDIWDLIDILHGYEAKGYELHAIVVDYPELITKKRAGATSTKRSDEVITYTFEVLRNHCFNRGITQITAHQLSTEAQKLAREGTAGFAKKVATGSYYMGAQSLATKLDGECILHIHRIGDESYLTFARGKHRGGEETPLKHRSFAYRFEKYGGIVDDLHEEGIHGKAMYSFAGIDGGAGEVQEQGNMVIDTDW